MTEQFIITERTSWIILASDKEDAEDLFKRMSEADKDRARWTHELDVEGY